MGKRLLNKIAAPKLKKGILLRERLFKLLDQAEHETSIWLAGYVGSGKTTLIAGYLAEKRLPSIWYQIDAGDSDLSSFFYFLGQAAVPLIDPRGLPLPLLTPEYLLGIETFITRYFQKLFHRLSPPTWIVH